MQITQNVSFVNFEVPFFYNFDICDKSNEIQNTAWFKGMFKRIFLLCDAPEKDCYRFFLKLIPD